jgi:TrmH family RNA methyltransferase
VSGIELTSTKSARVTAARRLAKRTARTQQRLFLAEGPQAVREAAVRPGVVKELFITAEAARRHPELAALAGIPTHQVSGQVMDSLAQTVTPQGAVAVCGYLDVPLDMVIADRPSLVAVLAAVRDPGNAGTVIRVADAAGADAVVLTDSSVDVYNGKCVRATAGSLFHLPW